MIDNAEGAQEETPEKTFARVSVIYVSAGLTFINTFLDREYSTFEDYVLYLKEQLIEPWIIAEELKGDFWRCN